MARGFLSPGFGVATYCDVTEAEELPLSRGSWWKIKKDHATRTTCGVCWCCLTACRRMHLSWRILFLQEYLLLSLQWAVRSWYSISTAAFLNAGFQNTVCVHSPHWTEEAAVNYHSETDFRIYLCFTCAPEQIFL